MIAWFGNYNWTSTTTASNWPGDSSDDTYTITSCGSDYYDPEPIIIPRKLEKPRDPIRRTLSKKKNPNAKRRTEKARVLGALRPDLKGHL